MRRASVLIAAIIASFVLCSRVEAGIFTDDLRRCFLKNINAADQLTLLRGIFSAIATHPALQSLSSITPAQRETLANNMTALYERLPFVDCRKEAVIALKYEGPQSLSAGFNVLGDVAARNLLGNPGVAHFMSDLGKSFDRRKLAALYKEAGVPLPPSKATTK